MPRWEDVDRKVRTGTPMPSAWGGSGTLLGKLWGRKVPVVDPSFGDPRLARMRAAALEGGPGRWAAVRAPLAAAHGPEDQSFLVTGIHKISGVERWISDEVEQHPDDTLALLVSGARHVAWAWQARGGGWGSSVPEPQLTLFQERLRIAERQLFEVAEREPHWAAPWYFLQMCGRGLQVGPEEAAKRFEATLRRAPGHVGAHLQHLQQVSGKWGGSHREMFDFARRTARSAPEGSPLGQLVAMAHLENWLDDGGGEVSPVLRDPGVVRELHATAALSVHHPAFVRERDWAIGVNIFAMAFALAGENAAARVMFRSLGGRVTETPWIYINGQSPVVPFLAWRTRVGA
ncbi:hypothetical protein [Streptomyces sp. NPDC049040]|uniref:hypothetical protein n=1 Tax=Streptomyces sp. NPDC049040 TaxID=3365593 RepID=UPI0037177AED